MKNVSQKIHSLWAILAGMCVLFALVSCGEITDSSKKGTVSFTISPTMLKSIVSQDDSSRSAVALEGLVVEENEPSNPSYPEEEFDLGQIDRIKVQIALRGDYNASKSVSFSAADLNLSGDDISVKKKITFDNIPLGSSVSAVAIVYATIEEDGETYSSVFAYGESKNTTISSGTNKLTLALEDFDSEVDVAAICYGYIEPSEGEQQTEYASYVLEALENGKYMIAKVSIDQNERQTNEIISLGKYEILETDDDKNPSELSITEYIYKNGDDFGIDTKPTAQTVTVKENTFKLTVRSEGNKAITFIVTNSDDPNNPDNPVYPHPHETYIEHPFNFTLSYDASSTANKEKTFSCITLYKVDSNFASLVADKKYSEVTKALYNGSYIGSFLNTSYNNIVTVGALQGYNATWDNGYFTTGENAYIAALVEYSDKTYCVAYLSNDVVVSDTENNVALTMTSWKIPLYIQFKFQDESTGTYEINKDYTIFTAVDDLSDASEYASELRTIESKIDSTTYERDESASETTGRYASTGITYKTEAYKLKGLISGSGYVSPNAITFYLNGSAPSLSSWGTTITKEDGENSYTIALSAKNADESDATVTFKTATLLSNGTDVNTLATVGMYYTLSDSTLSVSANIPAGTYELFLKATDSNGFVWTDTVKVTFN